MPTYRKPLNELDIRMTGPDRLAYRCTADQAPQIWVEARFFQDILDFDEDEVLTNFLEMFTSSEYEVGILMPDDSESE